MSVENGVWVMHGVDWKHPECIHTVEELEDYVEIPSSKLPFPDQPEMKAKEITDALIPAILSNKSISSFGDLYKTLFAN